MNDNPLFNNDLVLWEFLSEKLIVLVFPDMSVSPLLDGMKGSRWVGFLGVKASSGVGLTSVGETFSRLQTWESGGMKLLDGQYLSFIVCVCVCVCMCVYVCVCLCLCVCVKLAYQFIYNFVN